MPRHVFNLTTLKQHFQLVFTNHLTTLKNIPTPLLDAMQYSTLQGGKRLRPLLVYSAGLTCNGNLSALDAAACAIECIHIFSLIHDDLPSMDNDDWRRGQPTCHKKFDEATAILAGDALLALAGSILCQNSRLSSSQRLDSLQTLFEATGPTGMIGGQILDMQSAQDNFPHDIAVIEDIYLRKTAALFRASVKLGAIAANCQDNSTLTALDSYAQLLGLAFQIKDDIADHNPNIHQDCQQKQTKDRNKAEAADQNATPIIDSSSLALQRGASEASKRSLLNINEHCEQGRNKAVDQNATPIIDSSSLALQQGASEASKRSLLNINEHCEQGRNKAADQNATPPIDSSSLALQQGAPEVSKRSLLNINEHCEQGRNEAADQNATPPIDSSSLALQQDAPEVSKRSLLNINEHCEQGCNEAAEQNATPPIDSSSLALQQGAPEVSKRSLLNINEHCEQGCNEAADQNAKSLRRLEAQHIINITQKIHTNSPHQTIAILVTARNHLQQIIPELKACNIPFNAVELENLNDSIVIQDLLALTRALTNVTDRIAWLAILRAPWCGLCLGDLHALANTNNDNNDENILTIWENLNNYQDNSKLSADGKNRIAKILPILQYSIYNRGRSNLRDWIEKTWLAIGGPGTVNEQAELTHAEQFWPLLETTASSSYTIDIKLLTQKLEQLHVGQSDPTAAIQIMTIHKAKGLEFDHVIVSGLDQTTRSDDNQILMWLERPRLHHNSDLLMAPT